MASLFQFSKKAHTTQSKRALEALEQSNNEQEPSVNELAQILYATLQNDAQDNLPEFLRTEPEQPVSPETEAAPLEASTLNNLRYITPSIKAKVESKNKAQEQVLAFPEWGKYRKEARKIQTIRRYIPLLKRCPLKWSVFMAELLLLPL